MSTDTLLTIAIPTKNRAFYLKQNLEQLKREIAGVSEKIELIVSDNCSSDETENIVRSCIDKGYAISYVRNDQDIGWGRNFLQCFTMARGAYVLILGDDDFIVDGGLALLVDRLRAQKYGVVCLKPYGFDFDFRSEFPSGTESEVSYSEAGRFVHDVGALLTLISCCVINKQVLSSLSIKFDEIDSKNLPVLHLVLRAALSASRNLFIKKYLVGCKRNNSANYIFSEIFVNEMWRIIESFATIGLDAKTLYALRRRLLISYYPQYILQGRLLEDANLYVDLYNFDQKFGRSLIYKFWLRPLFIMPRTLAIAYGTLIVFFGRVYDGDLFRGVSYASKKIGRLIRH